MSNNSILWFNNITLKDLPLVGGKNASLGEMITHLTKLGVKVPQGFAITTEVYREFLGQNLLDKKIYQKLENLNVEEVQDLQDAASQIRQWIMDTPFPVAIEASIKQAYKDLAGKISEITGEKNSQKIDTVSVAVRSSATAEDLPSASFAGQQDTYLNISGENNVLLAVKKVFASLFTDRAIAYRVHHHFPHHEIALSVGIQQMVRSDLAVSGVMFTLDTETGFDKVVFITAGYGLGELLVQGTINPDEYYVYKPALERRKKAIIQKRLGSKANKMIYDNASVVTVPVPKEDQQQFTLNETELETLAKQAMLIEKHYQCPMDIEWAKDGECGQLYIVQARPETVKSRSKTYSLERYILKSAHSSVLIEGRSVGQRINSGKAHVIKSVNEIKTLQKGSVLVTDMTDPDWEPIMKRAAAIVTNRGGRTCHAAIVARELGIPAVVGCGEATEKIKDNQNITVSCAEGDTGFVYEGLLDFEVKRFDLSKMPELSSKIMMIIGNPERAFDFQRLPNYGVGLARLEFIINRVIGIHPKACLEFDKTSPELRHKILEHIAGYDSPVSFYVEKLTEGINTLAAAFAPKSVIVRLSDFKSNEYANLLGGAEFEPKEENPMLGFRGASRYIAENSRACFALECKALRKAREEYGFTNIEIMVPFVRTPAEAKKVVELLAENGLKRGENGLRLIMMCEIPTNALQADEFLQFFDGFSIGSNDLTQLTLGIDRDSGLVAEQFDERDPAVKTLLSMAIDACKKANKYIGICGQGPSDYPDFARWLLDKEIDSISLNPDSVISTWLELGKGRYT